MTRFLVFIGGTVGSGIGWALGSRAGLFTSFMLSLLGTAVGVYYGRRIGKNFE